jgi:hypothetical protein
MSELGRQLVENERKREVCLNNARRLLSELIVAVNFGDEEGLSELDHTAAQKAFSALFEAKRNMRKLRREHSGLAAAGSK